MTYLDFVLNQGENLDIYVPNHTFLHFILTVLWRSVHGFDIFHKNASKSCEILIKIKQFEKFNPYFFLNKSIIWIKHIAIFFVPVPATRLKQTILE
jgi:hypothetical protein